MTVTRFFLTLGAALTLLTACASIPENQLSDPIRDPNEAMNRAVFDFNIWTDKNLIRPVSNAYRFITPDPLEQSFSNFFRNLREPWVFVNDILQGKIGRAGTTLSRFVINSTIGLAGFFKVSDDLGIEHHTEDFGQTLATWGIKSGSYVVLPFIGPSSWRDFVGVTANFFGDPTTLTLVELEGRGLAIAYFGADALETRARLHDTIEALYREKDPYIVARAAYFQNRDYQIRDGQRVDTDEDDLFDELGDDEFDDDNGGSQ